MFEKIALRSASVAVLAASLLGAGISTASAENLKVAADVGFAPFVMRNANGQIDGYSYDLIQAVAKKAGYTGVEVSDTPFNAIFAGLFSNRFDLVFSPVNVTNERASQMLFTEPYLAGGVGFLVKKGSKLASLEELKGKTIAVNNGNFSDKWLQDNQSKYGFEIQRYNKNADAVQAVLTGRAFANMAETAVIRYITTQTPQAEVAYNFNTGTNMGYAVRKADVVLRNKVEQAVECLKADGTMAKIHIKWFGSAPEADTSGAKIFPGYGAPGFDGYDTTPHTAKCS
ncbi:MAG: amino acid ABC transporter substrate-binding protein [Rhodoferax sp.]|jgi:polar amino acid transport system substrate-binding protein|uniref:substrate-binding periplasmic protein n=1 Tax=Rhodoferax sp. TaxID=50421 RepID=UPI001B6CBC75|nr:ABC transporter substrate-binding protein [Rhodoferax sp.]MBP9736069.1 amino acid ABC transporter substrate-binding protein [Rhodoferax sp.]MBP9907365.1 amino acid ABC transporter substrate-binding protein [Rhodoferax sp.]